jgi:predicted nucleotidyltransferase component of viral defense system
MSVLAVQEKLLSYQCKTLLEQENALKEIMQEIALMALSRSDFFRIAAFQGGTCLRILYGLERFSEDLDFVLEKPNKDFDWRKYVSSMREEFIAYGFELEVQERNKIENAVKVTFLKADSEGGLLILKDNRTHKAKLKIKLEIDTNSPEGSSYELKYLDFPLPYSIRTQDLPSLFSGKLHALLCRPYTKGRDWYDFIWYVSRQVKINDILLNEALYQFGPWKGQKMQDNTPWFLEELRKKILSQDWEFAKQDVARFLKERELVSLDIWSKDFFLSRLEKLKNYSDPKLLQ